MLGAVKRACEQALLRTGVSGLVSAVRGSRTVVLAYHNVADRGEGPAVGEASLHISRSRFEAHCDLLVSRYRVVPLRDALGELDSGASGGVRVAITFDDAYRGAVRWGLPALAERGFPATMFVVPGAVGGGAFWWDAVAAPRTGEIEAAERERALKEDRGEGTAVRARYLREGRAWQAPPSDLLPAALSELERAATIPGIEFGAHTWSHPNLAALSPTEQETELGRAKDWVDRHLPGRSIPMLTYPYGLVDEQAKRIAQEVGFEAGFLVEGGPIRSAPADPFAIPRINVPAGMSAAGLALRLDGLLAR